MHFWEEPSESGQFGGPPETILGVYLFILTRQVFLCSCPSHPGTHSVDLAVLELRDLPASASQVLGLKACTIMSSLIWFF